MTFDWNDPQTRRRLCSALVEIVNQYGPEGQNIADLADHVPTLTAREVEAVKAYFGPDRLVGEL